jgi:hypothetical protein
MPSPELREMIDLGQAGQLVALAAVGAAVVAVVLLGVGVLWAGGREPLMRVAAALAPWSVALDAGWRAYLWRVRFDPASGFCGLHSVRVLLGNVVFAVLAGLAYGLYLRWLWGLPLSAPSEQIATRED